MHSEVKNTNRKLKQEDNSNMDGEGAVADPVKDPEIPFPFPEQREI